MLKPSFIRKDGKYIAIVNISDVLNEIDPENNIDYLNSGSLIRKWADDHNATYYAAPSESFSTHKAVDKAIAEGKTAVIVEDLS